MYFIFEIEFNSNKSYIKDLIIATAKVVDIIVEVSQDNKKIYIVADKDDIKLEDFLLQLEQRLPASIYMEQSKHYFSDKKPDIKDIETINLPHSIALCPTCQKEIFDISSPRFYYPFTSCNGCGAKHPFLLKYPFVRENTLMSFFHPCSSCNDELESNPFRESYPLISCSECGIPIKMLDKNSERIANTKGEYLKLFEVTAKALDKGKVLLVKTLNGYRKFYKANTNLINPNTILMICDANRLNSHLMLIPQEFNAILSIERPLLRVATKSQEIKEFFPHNTLVKYPDEGFSILIAKELSKLGVDYICYEEASKSEDADYLVDFDLPITTQEDCKLFVNQDSKLFVNGERLIYPLQVENPKGRVVVANKKLISSNIADNLELFDIEPKDYYLQKGDNRVFTTNRVREFSPVKASVISVVAENSLLEDKAVAIYFENELHFSYYNGKSVVDVLNPSYFNSQNVLGHIRLLREGSDRLVENYKKSFPNEYNRLFTLGKNEEFFKVVAIALGLEDESIEAISSESLHFMGKGGIQIDTKLSDNKFDYIAFLASILSYKVANVENNLICYSIYESFGDYIGDIVNQISQKVDTKNIILSGTAFANQPLYARIQKNLSLYNILTNKNIPINKESALYGAQYL